LRERRSGSGAGDQAERGNTPGHAVRGSPTPVEPQTIPSMPSMSLSLSSP
jgi:hypothetical protein